MPKANHGRFDGNMWYENHMIARTTAALKEKEEAFANDHSKDTPQELIDYVKCCAKELGYTPAECEVIGGTYIAQRLGEWPAVLRMAHLTPNHACLPLTKRAIFLEEREIQAELHRQERKAKRETRASSNKHRAQEKKNREHE